MRFVYWMTDAQDRLPWPWRRAPEPRFAKVTWKLLERHSKILWWLVLWKWRYRPISSSKSLSTRLLSYLTVSRWFTTYQCVELPWPSQPKSCPVLKRLSPISIGFDWLKQKIVTWGGHHGHRRIQRFFGLTASQLIQLSQHSNGLRFSTTASPRDLLLQCKDQNYLELFDLCNLQVAESQKQTPPTKRRKRARVAPGYGNAFHQRHRDRYVPELWSKSFNKHDRQPDLATWPKLLTWWWMMTRPGNPTMQGAETLIQGIKHWGQRSSKPSLQVEDLSK